jgi:hypothetical protein
MAHLFMDEKAKLKMLVNRDKTLIQMEKLST